MNADDPSFPGLLKSAWAARIYVVCGLVSGACLAVLLMLSLTPVYQAHMIVAPPNQTGEDRSLTILNENSASSRMMSVSSQVSRDYTKFQQIFREASVSRVLAKYQGILGEVNKDRIFRFSGSSEIEEAGELSNYIKAHVTIDPLGATTSQVLTYRHPDRLFAEKFLRHLHKITDEMIRNDARQQTDNRILYLQKALREAYNPDHRKALTDQLMLEERQKMVISMDEPFSAEIVENAVATSKPVWPKPVVLFPVCLLVGGFLGFLIYATRFQKTR